ncbi:MAG TPA: chromate efflux transporter [Dissulfurispiraceae bacterium]|nr:chromate efflux transporter [Dissulfurispiraceae bacterium]
MNTAEDPAVPLSHIGANHPSATELFMSFLRLGMTAFGGPAIIAQIRDLTIEKRGWLSEESFADGLALCQTLPGPIVVNVAAYVGLRVGGLAGMIASFGGFLLPAFLLLLALSAAYRETSTLPVTVSLFSGLQLIVVAIILNAMLTFGRVTFRGFRDVFIAILSAAALLGNVSPFVVIIGAACAGALLHPAPGLMMTSAHGHSTRYLKDSAGLLACFVTALGLLYATDHALFDLAVVMPKIVFFSFGGGYTTLPLMFHEVVEARSWLDGKTFMDGIALGQVTPGPVLITATFVGYLFKGIPGAIVGTLGIFCPGLVLVTAMLPFYDRLKSSPSFMKATRGVLAAFVGLLLYVGVKFGGQVPWDAARVLFGLGALAALIRKIDVLYLVLAGGILSLVLF